MPPDQVQAGLQLSLAELDRHFDRVQDAMRAATSNGQFERAQDLVATLQLLAGYRERLQLVAQEWKKSIASKILPIANKPLPKQIGPHGKAPRSGLRVTLPGNRVIVEPTAAETLASVLEAFGLEAVAKLGVMVAGEPLISRRPSEKYSSSKRGSWYVMTHSSTADKRKRIEHVAKELGISVRVEITT